MALVQSLLCTHLSSARTSAWAHVLGQAHVLCAQKRMSYVRYIGHERMSYVRTLLQPPAPSPSLSPTDTVPRGQLCEQDAPGARACRGKTCSQMAARGKRYEARGMRREGEGRGKSDGA